MSIVRVLDSVASVDPQVAKQDGYSAILRYLAGNNPLSSAEVAGYTAANFGVGSLWELNPTAVANGENQGVSDAQNAVRAAQSLGQPKGTAIYFACDTDPSLLPGGPSGGVPYYRGTAAVRQSGYLSGCYGGAALVNACLSAGVIDRAMIPNAPSWSDGQVPRRDDVQQGYPYVVITGEQYDPDTANTDTAGLWNGHGHWPVVAPPKPPTPPTHPQEDDMKLVFAQGDALPGVPKDSWWYVGYDRSGRWATIVPNPGAAGTDNMLLGHVTITTAEMVQLLAGH